MLLFLVRDDKNKVAFVFFDILFSNFARLNSQVFLWFICLVSIGRQKIYISEETFLSCVKEIHPLPFADCGCNYDDVNGCNRKLFGKPENCRTFPKSHVDDQIKPWIDINCVSLFEVIIVYKCYVYWLSFKSKAARTERRRKKLLICLKIKCQFFQFTAVWVTEFREICLKIRSWINEVSRKTSVN